MFIIFGHRATKIGEELKMVNNGGTMENALIRIYQNYAHIFWIPMFPLNRNYILYFPETGAIYEKTLFRKMPENYKEICKQVSRNAKTPWWTFIGLVIIIISIIGLSITP